jgi:methyl-coenzyme M reductase subunit D
LIPMSKKPTAEYAGIPLPEVEIFSDRLLNVETTEKMLNALDCVACARQINMTGESLPAVLGSGPNKGLDNNHTERRTVKVGDREVELRYQVGAFYVELDVEDEEQLDSAVEEIRAAADEHLTHGYSMHVGRYSKFKPTLIDYR